MKLSTRVRFTTVGACAMLFAACSNSTAFESRPSHVNDPAGDFIPSFTGPRNADLDVRTMEVSYVGANSFVFDASMEGNVGLTPGGLYVWGINRGAGTPRFGSIATGVLFDFVVIVKPGGTSSVRDLLTNVGTDLPASSVTVNGKSIQVRVPASLIPSQGFTPSAYTVNLWPRTGLGMNNQISDFAPDNSNAPVRVVP
ncbi:MAG: hypothetical protein NVS4B3_24880 [Gemmatimonadaceae bacterium]